MKTLKSWTEPVYLVNLMSKPTHQSKAKGDDDEGTAEEEEEE